MKILFPLLAIAIIIASCSKSGNGSTSSKTYTCTCSFVYMNSSFKTQTYQYVGTPADSSGPITACSDQATLIQKEYGNGYCELQ